MRYKLLVVGTDGSATARVTEEVAMSVARGVGAEVLFVSAYEKDDLRPDAERTAEAAGARAAAAGATARSDVAQGDPASVIVEMADRAEADLIVVGDAAMGKRRRVGLGGVADRVSHAMPCDTLIVRSAKQRGPGWSHGKVLLATDGSSTASHAVRVGAELARGVGAAMEIIHVKDEVMGALIMQESAVLTGGHDVPGHRLTGGDVGKSIADTAADFDLVVVGNKGMSGSVRMFMGKVPDAVSHLAPCDVLIVNTVDRSLSEVAPGEGAVVTVDGKKVAAFREQDGSPVLLSPRCQHLGCTVGWNEAAGTWDCPCHGSRYDPYGKVIQGPASRDLSPATT